MIKFEWILKPFCYFTVTTLVALSMFFTNFDIILYKTMAFMLTVVVGAMAFGISEQTKNNEIK